MGDDEGLGRPGLPMPGAGGNNRLLMAGVISASIIFIVLAIFMLRSSLPVRTDDYSKILTYLSAKEASEVTIELKTLKIPYKLEDKGATILVPKAKADEARLGLANKNLPRGGVVGFEIFDKTGLGTTDFDRRIKFVRAISGELSRNISLIEGVEDARVQIVIPETQLFVGKKSPVTASVLLRLKANHKLQAEQINGIVHLVSGSVEDLSPENVTVVDINGYILTSTTGATAQPLEKISEISPEVLGEQTVVESSAGKKEVISDNIIEQLNYKDELERRLTDKSQEVLNKFYLPDKARVWVTVDLGPVKKSGQTVPAGSGPQIPWEINKINTVILISDAGPLTEKNAPFENIRNDTYSLVAAAIGYNKNRGDRIEMRRVPFTEGQPDVARVLPDVPGEVTVSAPPATGTGPGTVPIKTVVTAPEPAKKTGFLMSVVGLVLEWLGFLFSKNAPLTFKILGFFMLAALAGAVVWSVFIRKGGRQKKPTDDLKISRESSSTDSGLDMDSIPEIQKIRDAAADQPEKLASILKSWLSEEQGGG